MRYCGEQGVSSDMGAPVSSLPDQSYDHQGPVSSLPDQSYDHQGSMESDDDDDALHRYGKHCWLALPVF